MNIYRDDGVKVLKFIREQLGHELPQRGLLAGQSICSVLMYMKGLENHAHVNDLDIFIPVSRRRHRSYLHRTCFYQPQVRPYMQVSRDYFFKSPEMYKEYDRRLTEIAEAEHEKVPPKDDFIIECFEDAKAGDLNGYSEALRRLHACLKKRNFLEFSEGRYGGYDIESVMRKGILNYVFVRSKIKDFFTPNPWQVIQDFDMNCTQVAIDLSDGRIYYTPAFLQFMKSRQLEIVNINRPHHTIIRYFHKREQFGYYGNDELAIDLTTTILALSALDEESTLFQMEPAGKCSLEHRKFKVSMFGEGYANKYREAHQIKKGFRLYSSRRKVKFLHDTPSKVRESIPKMTKLYLTKPRQDGSKYILEGQHRKELKRRVGIELINYPTYAIAALPKILGEHYGIFRKKLVAQSHSLVENTKFNTRTRVFSNSILNDSMCCSPEIHRGHSCEDHFNSINEYLATHLGMWTHFKGRPLSEQYERYMILKWLEKRRPEMVYTIEQVEIVDWSILPDKEAFIEHVEKVHEEFEKSLREHNTLKKEDLPHICINGMEVVELITNYALKEEGRYQRHCVGSYGWQVKRRYSYIVSVRKNLRDRATCELRYSKNGWKVIQYRSKLNTKPGADFYKTLEAYLEVLEDIEPQISSDPCA